MSFKNIYDFRLAIYSIMLAGVAPLFLNLYLSKEFDILKNMETIKIHPKNKEQLIAIKAMLKAFKIPFERAEKESYNPEFVEKIKESEKNEDGSVLLNSEKDIEDYFTNL